MKGTRRLLGLRLAAVVGVNRLEPVMWRTLLATAALATVAGACGSGADGRARTAPQTTASKTAPAAPVLSAQSNACAEKVAETILTSRPWTKQD